MSEGQILKDVSELVPIITDKVQELIYDNGYDENNIRKNNWDYILKCVNSSVIEPNRHLFYNRHKHCYIVSGVYILYKCYLVLCYKYNQMINIMSFSYLSGIYYQALSNIYINSSVDKNLNSINISLTKKILEDSEQTAVNLLQDAKTPLPYITILNNRFGWTQSGVSRREEDSTKQTALTDAKKLFELYENDTQLTQIETQEDKAEDITESYTEE